MRTRKQKRRSILWPAVAGMRVARSAGALLAVLGLMLGMAAEGSAVTLNPGDILVSDAQAFGGTGGIIRVNPLTGAQTTVSSGGSFVDPAYVTLDGAGQILVSDLAAFGGSGGIIRVNPGSGVQTTVSNNAISTAAGGGAFFGSPIGIALDTAGQILVSDLGIVSGVLVVRIIRVDPMTGAQTLVSSGSSAVSPEPGGIALDALGRILVADAFGAFAGRIIRVDPGTGSQTTISSGGSLVDPFDVALDAAGQILVADASAFGGGGGIIRVDPGAGVQTTVSNNTLSVAAGGGAFFVDPVGVAVVAAPVPEPASLLLFGSGLATLAARRWRRRAQTDGAGTVGSRTELPKERRGTP